jgi:hypothetical protein
MYSTDSLKDGVFMIHHQFTDSFGNIISSDNFPVPIEGTARLWILSPEMRNTVHRDRLRVGTKYFIMEGSRKVGVGIITAIIGLYTNPSK